MRSECSAFLDALLHILQPVEETTLMTIIMAVMTGRQSNLHLSAPMYEGLHIYVIKSPMKVVFYLQCGI